MVVLNREVITDRWMQLLAGCAGQAAVLFDHLEDGLAATRMPGVSWQVDSLASSWIKGILGKREDGLIVTNGRHTNAILAITVADYGSHLMVVRYVLARSSLTHRLLSAIGFRRGNAIRYQSGASVDALDDAEHHAWLAVTDECVKEAIEQIVGGPRGSPTRTSTSDAPATDSGEP